jgi:hypothetical protein
MPTHRASILGSLAMVLIALGGCSSASTPTPTPTPTVTPSPSGTITPTASPTETPTPEPTPFPSPTPDTSGVATRIVIVPLKIDLPVVAEGPNETFPLCNVAEYFVDNSVKPAKPFLATPGAAQATYLYAYARTGCSCRSSKPRR